MSVFKRRRPDEDVPPLRPAPESGAPVHGTAAPEPVPADNGLGVPPFRPASLKEAPTMGRTPFASSSAPGGVPGPAPSPVPGPRPIGPGRGPARDSAERRTLVVGHGISVQGTVQDAERLVVEGTVEATMIHATELAIAPGGVFKGEVEVEEAEIAGTIDGTLTARGSLIVRTSGKVLGTARCRRLQVEDGGHITGRMEMLSEHGEVRAGPREVSRAEAGRATAEPAA